MWCFHPWERDQNKAAYQNEPHSMTMLVACDSCITILANNYQYFPTLDILRLKLQLSSQLIHMYSGFFRLTWSILLPLIKNPLKPITQVLHIEKPCLWFCHTLLDICGSWMNPDSCLPMRTKQVCIALSRLCLQILQNTAIISCKTLLF